MAVGSLTKTDRFVNILLLLLLLLQGVTGIVMLYGTWQPWVFDLHRMAGIPLLVLAPWKGAVIYRSLFRGMNRTFDRSLVILISIVFAHLVLLVVILGFLWMWRFGPYSVLGQTLLSWHWILGLLLLPFIAFHVLWRWPEPRKQDFFTRRDFLKVLGVAGAGIAGGSLATLLAEARSTRQMPRHKITGSRAFGIYSGNDFPVVGERPLLLDVESWRLEMGGAVRTPSRISYQEILAHKPERLDATLDCTNGWYSLQGWQGIPLIELLEETGWMENSAGVRLVSATGYHHSYPIQEARKVLLATHVTGEVLSPAHGFPLRAVVPGRRGWFWVKWLTGVYVLESPMEVIAGVLGSPREVLRQWQD
jgi:DMSO/TMAO reductase YedYZ molybdopterin-dependent catalytic subunit